MTKTNNQAGFIKYLLIIIILVVILAILNVDLAAWADWRTWPERLAGWWQWLEPYLSQILSWTMEQIRQPLVELWHKLDWFGKSEA